jgi:putative hydrolase of the HAD superfamily
MRKPDVDIFRLALDLAQTPAEQVAFIANTAMFVKIAEGLGMRGILHTDYKSTSAKLASFGLQMDGGGLQDTEQTTQSGDGRMTADVVTQF